MGIFDLLQHLLTRNVEMWVLISSPLKMPQGPCSCYLQMAHECLPSSGAAGHKHFSPTQH
jgi:hypothetical protein